MQQRWRNMEKLKRARHRRRRKASRLAAIAANTRRLCQFHVPAFISFSSPRWRDAGIRTLLNFDTRTFACILFRFVRANVRVCVCVRVVRVRLYLYSSRVYVQHGLKTGQHSGILHDSLWPILSKLVAPLCQAHSRRRSSGDDLKSQVRNAEVDLSSERRQVWCVCNCSAPSRCRHQSSGL